MKVLSEVADFVGSSLFSELRQLFVSYFPPQMTPAQKAKAELDVQQFLHEKEVEVNNAFAEATAQLDKRIAEQEGTASDLKSIPLLGPIVLFARGVQRPCWGFATLWMDFKWFFGAYSFSDQQQTAMIVINVLVLGFLFGERTIKNLEPLLVKVFGNNARSSS